MDYHLIDQLHELDSNGFLGDIAEIYDGRVWHKVRRVSNKPIRLDTGSASFDGSMTFDEEMPDRDGIAHNYGMVTIAFSQIKGWRREPK